MSNFLASWYNRSSSQEGFIFLRSSHNILCSLNSDITLWFHLKSPLKLKTEVFLLFQKLMTDRKNNTVVKSKHSLLRPESNTTMIKHTVPSLTTLHSFVACLTLGKYDFPLGPNCLLSFPLENVRKERAVISFEPYNNEASMKLTGKRLIIFTCLTGFMSQPKSAVSAARGVEKHRLFGLSGSSCGIIIYTSEGLSTLGNKVVRIFLAFGNCLPDFALLDCPQIGNNKLLQLPFMVLYLAVGSHTGLGKHRSAKSMS
ncbi:hypothetical protein AGLY_009373 [Aphis glycines]|uniref:Uncharacterized protein n=1 Tax=Aphis glycines TaxID=307491 RepID=A0A6G0THN0_APHGL|nr:hypothetical protein AGLY_009373 [Aphis glycines]